MRDKNGVRIFSTREYMRSYHQSPEEYEKAYGQSLDKEIKPLVNSLNEAGYATYAACEGGAGHCTTYPWVGIVPTASISNLRAFVKEYNKLNATDWELQSDRHTLPVITPEDVHSTPEGEAVVAKGSTESYTLRLKHSRSRNEIKDMAVALNKARRHFAEGSANYDVVYSKKKKLVKV
jgi:hypothetical protein